MRRPWMYAPLAALVGSSLAWAEAPSEPATAPAEPPSEAPPSEPTPAVTEAPAAVPPSLPALLPPPPDASPAPAVRIGGFADVGIAATPNFEAVNFQIGQLVDHGAADAGHGLGFFTEVTVNSTPS